MKTKGLWKGSFSLCSDVHH